MTWPDDFINKIICGDCLKVMKNFPDESIDMVLTSPPYWGLRDYGIEQIFGGDKDCEHEWNYSSKEHDNLRYRRGSSIVGNEKNKIIHSGKTYSSGWFCSKCQAWKGQLGLEPTPEIYIEHLTQIFNEAKRVLKKEGTLWLNMGDTYGGSNTGHAGPAQTKWQTVPRGNGKSLQGKLQPKCLLMIPERLAWSLIQNGWILRNKIVWIKPNCMPSSVKDRFTNKWEHIFLFSKSRRYYFDLDAVREAHKSDTPQALRDFERMKKGRQEFNGTRKTSGYQNAFVAGDPKGKNPGDVWIINTQPCPVKGIHFATFPEKLCEKAIKTGCPEEICKKCGKARERITKGTSQSAFNIRVRDVKKGRIKHTDRKASQKEIDKYKEGKTHVGEGIKTVGWTSCDCNAGFEPGIVLDPFCGIGTTCFVARDLKRNYIGIDIKKEYCEKAERKRLAQGVL